MLFHPVWLSSAKDKKYFESVHKMNVVWLPVFFKIYILTCRKKKDDRICITGQSFALSGQFSHWGWTIFSDFLISGLVIYFFFSLCVWLFMEESFSYCIIYEISERVTVLYIVGVGETYGSVWHWNEHTHKHTQTHNGLSWDYANMHVHPLKTEGDALFW